MYSGQLELIDERGHPLGYSPPPRRELSFRNALVESTMPGCTTVMNSAARSLLIKERPAHALCHDWWAYLVISALGAVIFDDEPHIRYRLHANNQFGVAAGPWQPWLAKLAFFTGDPHAHAATRQATDLRRIYGPLLDPEVAAILDRFLHRRSGFIARGRYALSGDVYRQSWRDQLALGTRILLDRL
jgi:hypothetical protein